MILYRVCIKEYFRLVLYLEVCPLSEVIFYRVYTRVLSACPLFGGLSSFRMAFIGIFTVTQKNQFQLNKVSLTSYQCMTCTFSYLRHTCPWAKVCPSSASPSPPEKGAESLAEEVGVANASETCVLWMENVIV